MYRAQFLKCTESINLSPRREEPKNVHQDIWADLPQASIDKAVLTFRKIFKAGVAANEDHFKQLLQSCK